MRSATHWERSKPALNTLQKAKDLATAMYGRLLACVDDVVCLARNDRPARAA